MSAQTAEDALMEALQAIRDRLIQHDAQIATLSQQIGDLAELVEQFARLARRYMAAQ